MSTCDDHPDAETYVETMDRTVAIDTVVIRRCVECDRILDRLDDASDEDDENDTGGESRDYFA